MHIKPAQFHRPIIQWFAQYGRKHLPWQQSKSPYHVWLSEIMLQQTQVETVIPYFEKFIDTFPTLQSLAAADLDHVLFLWSGLGYYARARRLHQTAKIIVQDYQGEFSQDAAVLQTWPGIGRSTAGAILALSMNKSAAILDGNVKRIFARFHALNDPLPTSKAQKQLWLLAEYYKPKKNIAAYTQALMDIGATVCTRSRPKCISCPVSKHCLAHQQGNPSAYPLPKISKPLPVRSAYLIILINSKHEIFLEKRPPVGIWGGLWSLPECPLDEDIKNWCHQQGPCEITNYETHKIFRHTFSHFHFDITPVVARVKNLKLSVQDAHQQVWQCVDSLESKALAAPVKKLLKTCLRAT